MDEHRANRPRGSGSTKKPGSQGSGRSNKKASPHGLSGTEADTTRGDVLQKNEEDRPGDIRNIKQRDPGKLCTTCGLCCIMLSAKIEEEEADRFCKEQGLKKENFCHRAEGEHDPNKGDLVITMPCRRLAGRPTAYVRCRAYNQYRPEVCGAYLCRVAMQYKAGFLEFDEAHAELKKAFVTGNVGYFNWTQVEAEGRLLQASVIPALLDQAKEAYKTIKNPTVSCEDMENIYVADAFTPVFIPSSHTEHLKLNMIFDIFDRAELELTDIIAPIHLEGLTEREIELAERIGMLVVSKFRSMFTEDR